MAKWMTQTELKESLGLANVSTVHNWIQRGLIKTKIVYGKQLVDANSIKKGIRGRPTTKKKTVKST